MSDDDANLFISDSFSLSPKRGDQPEEPHEPPAADETTPAPK